METIQNQNNSFGARKLLAIIILIAIIWGVSSALPHSKSDTVTIGLMVPLTGKSASIGERVRNASVLAIEDINNSAKPYSKTSKINLVIEDDKGESPSTISAVNKLIDTDKVHIIIGTVKSDPMLAIAPITEKNSVILFSPTAGADGITIAGDYVFRNIETADPHGKTAADFLSSKDIHTAGLLIANASNAQSYGKAFASHFSGNIGTVISSSTYNQDDSDYRTIVSKVISTKPQAIYIGVATAKDAGLIVKQIRELGFTAPVIVSIAANAPEFFTISGEKAEGTYISSSSFDPSVEPAKSYSDEYKAKYNSDSDVFAANAYDAVMIINSAIQSCGGDDDTSCIRDQIYATRNYQGVSGNTSFDKNGDVLKPVVIKIAIGGKFVPVK